MIKFYLRRRDPLRQLARLESARAVMATWTTTQKAVESQPESSRRRFFRSRKAS